jgi:hypothetical protein
MAYVSASKRRKKKKKKRRHTFLLTVLLALLGAVGTWNYKRNVEAEQKVPRPYQHYSAEQLDQLIPAYRADLDTLVARYEKVSGHSIGAKERSSIGDQIAEFERVQRQSSSVRELGYEISEREGMLRELEAERGRRDTQALGLKTFLRRVFTSTV